MLKLCQLFIKGFAMKAIGKLYTKIEIQYVYNFICYCLERSFNSIVVDENDEVKGNNHVHHWINENNFSSIKKALKKPLSPDDFDTYTKLPKVRLPLLLYHMKEAIYARVMKLKNQETLKTWYDSFNFINISNSMESAGIKSFHDIIFDQEKDLKNFVTIFQAMTKDEVQKNKIGIKTSWLSYLNQKHEAKVLEASSEVQTQIKHIKDKFNFKSLVIFPGECSNVIEVLDKHEEQFDFAVKSLDIPQEAIGLGILNVALFLETTIPNISFIHSSVSGYFFNKEKEFNICIKNFNDETKNTIVHEYAHFISSLIYENTGKKNRPEQSNNLIHKWNNDEKNQALMLNEAHSLKLDWVSKTLNLSTWEDLQYLRKNTPKNNGYRYLEHNFAQRMVQGLGVLSDGFLNSEPIIHDKMIRNFSLYMQGVKEKLIIYKIIDESVSIPTKNLTEATHFFLNESSFVYYHHNLKNPYIKALMRLSFLQSFVYYEANPEEIWARSFEALIDTGKSSVPDYRAFVNKKFTAEEVSDEMYKPKIHLNSFDRLHMLYIIKYVIQNFLPYLNFIPEESKCYKEFIKNNPTEDSMNTNPSEFILNSSINDLQKNY